MNINFQPLQYIYSYAFTRYCAKQINKKMQLKVFSSLQTLLMTHVDSCNETVKTFYIMESEINY